MVEQAASQWRISADSRIEFVDTPIDFVRDDGQSAGEQRKELPGC